MANVAGIEPLVAPSGPGCVECTAVGGWWFHLRRCAACGHVGCCDSSPAQHASAHYRQSSHEYVQSFEPGEDWIWSYRAEQFYDGVRLAGPTDHPADQPVPGPAGRVPADWQRRLH
jgi:Zn-finger in ubiquitin-hydrolases and other protein